MIESAGGGLSSVLINLLLNRFLSRKAEYDNYCINGHACTSRGGEIM